MLRMYQKLLLLARCLIPIALRVQIVAIMTMIAFAAVTTLLWEALSG